ncbi:hypothetical protein U1Q18_027080 [Sarracenia purpurea var. burkii]
MPSRPFPPNPNHKPKTSVFFLIITTFSSLVIVFSIFYFLYYIWYSLVHRSRTSPFDSGASSPVKLQRFNYKELKSATNEFSDANSIGKGGSGTVFRGILRDGKLVAVKMLDSSSLQTEREFQNELQILGGLRSAFVVSLLGYCVEKSKRFLVYEYMPNRSLQESLFAETSNLNWGRRFDIILDISRALFFLHLECDPPVIHGDVKPSNVLLDSEFGAKLSDFGLSRVKIEGEFGVDLFSQELGKSQELWKSQELSGNLAAVGGETPAVGTPAESCNEVDFALALQASSSSKNSRSSCNLRALNLNSFLHNANIEKGKEVSTIENGGEDLNKVVNYDDGLCSTDHSKELNLNIGSVAVDDSMGTEQWGKDWWWRQDGNGDQWSSKDYVMEWIGSQICPTANPNWEEEKNTSLETTNLDDLTQLDKLKELNETQLQEPEYKYPRKGFESKEEPRGWKPRKKHRKMQEWWKEEHLDEISKKTSRSKLKRLESKCKKGFKMQRFDLTRRKFGKQNQNEGDPNMEFSFRRGWKKKKKKSEMCSDDLFSRELSSTTSMRGTLCYVAPEYGGCGYLMEKADIYSLGVLILVIVSGRRPLHVLSSPMKLEKANLISWCRHLAQSGNVLELVDERLKDYSKEQASLCINLALACLQRMPELRPDIGEIVKILKGEMDLPPLPFEFSPSPPSKFFSRSRRKQKANAE